MECHPIHESINPMNMSMVSMGMKYSLLTMHTTGIPLGVPSLVGALHKGLCIEYMRNLKQAGNWGVLEEGTA